MASSAVLLRYRVPPTVRQKKRRLFLRRCRCPAVPMWTPRRRRGPQADALARKLDRTVAPPSHLKRLQRMVPFGPPPAHPLTFPISPTAVSRNRFCKSTRCTQLCPQGARLPRRIRVKGRCMCCSRRRRRVELHLRVAYTHHQQPA